MLGSFQGRRVAVVGMGKSNRALAKYLLREGALVTCFDRKTAAHLGQACVELSSLGAKWSLGDRYLDALPSFTWVFLTPGMKKNLPEIERARENGAVVSDEIALFLERCRARVAAVTGSAGKTTTCTLAGMMLRESLPEAPVYVGGNIGEVLIENADSIPDDALVVLELSSFQLELLQQSPPACLVLNVRPNHLDIHDSFEDYVAAKKRIYQFQKAQDWCVLNLDDPLTRDMARECPGNVGFFTLDAGAAQRAFDAGHAVAWLDGEDLRMRAPSRYGLNALDRGGEPVRLAGRKDFLVPGLHNVSNALGAALLSTIMGATACGIGRAIRAFAGVEHRIELVREVGGVTYVNDSIATSPDRTEALLEAVPGPLVLILGGYDKGLPFDGLARAVIARDCAVVTMGKTAAKIEEALRDAAGPKKADRSTTGRDMAGMREARAVAGLDVTRAGSLEEAVSLATAKARPGSSVVLSPACASFDMFADFEERGRLFKEIVRRLA
jgi:UDP-N-acetylmuramoylalanine--D-glutamate ligase